MIGKKNYNNPYKIVASKKIGKNLSTVCEKINVCYILIFIMIIILIIGIVFTINNLIEISREKAKQEEYKKLIAEQQLKEQQEIEEKKLAEEAEKKAKIPELTETGRQNMANIYSSETKRAFLTFDDGPSTVTPTILDVLKQEKVPATFFMLGSNVEKYPDIVKRAYDEGHYIANHGYTHSYSSIYSSTQAVLDEYNRCNDAVKNAIGVPEYNSHLFRFPGGKKGGPYDSIKQEADQLLSNNNILSLDWNALTGDAETNCLTGEYEMTKLVNTTSGKNSVVILLHDAEAKKVTADTLPQIITYLRQQGYEFKNIYDIFKKN